MRRSILLTVAAALLLVGCGEKAMPPEDFGTRVVKFPNGTTIRCEVMLHSKDLARGMMFRDKAPEDRGMLFWHERPANYPYWMFQVKMPLDIIWMDSNRHIVEISENTPPCEKGPASTCPNYGGQQISSIVLEVAGGMVRKHHLKVGDTLEF